MGADNSACNGERGGLVGACGTRGGDGDGAASRARDLKSQVSCGDGLAKSRQLCQPWPGLCPLGYQATRHHDTSAASHITAGVPPCPYLLIRSISHVLALSLLASRFTPLAARLPPISSLLHSTYPPYIPTDDALHPPPFTPSLPPSHPSSWACASALPMTTRSSAGGMARSGDRKS